MAKIIGPIDYLCEKFENMELYYCKEVIEGKAILDPEESHHCIRVLRHSENEEIMVSCGDGNLYRCRIETTDPRAVRLSVISAETASEERGYKLHMAVAPTKNMERIEWFIEKATEIGIDRITPLLCDHSERKVFKRERGERIILSAAKQSLKSSLPILDDLTSFSEFIEKSRSFTGKKFIAFCDPDAEKESLRMPYAKRP